jgi:hypothetical protein
MPQIEGYLSGLALAVFVKRGGKGGGKERSQRGRVLGQNSSCKTSIVWCENAKMKNNGLATSVVVGHHHHHDHAWSGQANVLFLLAPEEE